MVFAFGLWGNLCSLFRHICGALEHRSRLEQKMEAEEEARRHNVIIEHMGGCRLAWWLLQDMLKHSAVIFAIWTVFSVALIMGSYALEWSFIGRFWLACARFVFLVSLPLNWATWGWKFWKEPYLKVGWVENVKWNKIKIGAIRYFPPAFSLFLFWLCLVWFVVGLLWYVRGLIIWVDQL